MMNGNGMPGFLDEPARELGQGGGRLPATAKVICGIPILSCATRYA